MKHEELIKKVWGEEVESYDRDLHYTFVEKTKFKRDPVPEKASEIIKGFNFQSVLDVGCGTGRIILPLAEEFKGKFVGVDKSQKMLTAAKEKKGNLSGTIGLIKGDSRNLPFPDSEFGVVIEGWSLASLEQLQEMIRTLRKGGILILIGAEYGAEMDIPELLWKIIQENTGVEKPKASSSTLPEARKYLEERFETIKEIRQEWILHFKDVDEILQYAKSWMFIASYVLEKHGLWGEVRGVIGENFQVPLQIRNEIKYIYTWKNKAGS